MKTTNLVLGAACLLSAVACGKEAAVVVPPPDAGPTVVDVAFPVAPGSPGVTLLPKLQNVQAAVDDDRVSVTFEPVAGARDYRIYPLPSGGDVQVSASGAVAIHDALYRCAGDRLAAPAAKDADAGGANGWATTWVNRQVEGFARSEATDSVLGHVFAEAGAGRTAVYALGDPDSRADNECGGQSWAASRLKRYTTADSERQTLIASGWRDDGIAFYAPAAGDVQVQTALSVTTPLYFSSAAEVQARAALAPKTAFLALSVATNETVPLRRVYYNGGCQHSHDELITAGGYQRAVVQGAQPVPQVQWSGLTAETVLVVEALDAGCPWQGHLSFAAKAPAGNSKAFVTIDQVRAGASNGEVYLNGQHDAASTPGAVARSFVKVKPSAPAAMEWRAGFGPGESWTLTQTKAADHGYVDVTLAGNGTDAWFYNLEPTQYAVGAVQGELWVTYADWGSDTPAKFRLTPQKTGSLASDSYLHATMTVDLWSTGRRYAQLFVSDAPSPLQENLPQGTTVLLQTRNAWPFDLELQECDHRTWDVNNQCPRYRILHKPFVGAPWAPTLPVGELTSPGLLVKVDLYVSTTRAYVLLADKPYACAQLQAPAPAGQVRVTFGDVLYHSGVDEAVVAKPTAYQFLFDHQLTETRRQFDNLGFQSGVAAPPWNKALIPCATATDP